MIIHGKSPELITRAVSIAERHLQSMLAASETVVLGLVGGTSVAPLYTALASSNVDWHRLHIFLADERVVEPGSADANFTIIEECFNKVVPASNLHSFKADVDLDDFGAATYGRVLEEFGGRLDMVILSSGEDGHVASLFPGSPQLSEVSSSFVAVHDSPKPPQRRISASRALLEDCDAALLLITGEAKRSALEMVLDEHVAVEACPAKIVEQVPFSYVFTDVEV